MNQRITQKLDNLTRLLGYYSWERISSRCTGKWRGTTDYGIRFDDGQKLYLSNGMAGFETEVDEIINKITVFRTAKKFHMIYLEEQIAMDNIIAAKENLKSVELLDLGFVMENHSLYFWAKLKVGDLTIKHHTTNLTYALHSADWDKWRNKTLTTAAGVRDPDYIFMNWRFSSTDNSYKLKT